MLPKNPLYFSMDTLVSEVTPLLQSAKRIPWFQLSILLFLQIVEPLTSQVVNPFAPELLRDIEFTFGSESRVEYYVGLLRSFFYFAEAMTVLHWSRVSDQVGRKPVILIGLFGSILSMLCFGLSKSFWGLLLSRCISGALGGKIGVIRSMMAEMVDTADLARIYAFTPLALSTGATIGPLIGGYLSRPTERFPDIFSQIEFLKSYPYFLACIVPTALSVISFLVTHIFLQETVKSPAPVSIIFHSPKSQDVSTLSGVVTSAVVTQLSSKPSEPSTTQKSYQSLDVDGPAPGGVLQSTLASHLALETSIQPGPEIATNVLPIDPNKLPAPRSNFLQIPNGQVLRGLAVSAVVSRLPIDPNQLLPLRALLTRQVIIAVGNYAFMSLVDIAFREIQPLFLATPVSLGGLGMPPSKIANILSVRAVLDGCIQILFFAKVHNRLGSKNTFLVGVALSVPLFLVFPITSLLAKTQGFGILLSVAVGLQAILPIGFSLSSGAIFMYITAAAPNRESIGATNGLSQMLVNHMMGIVPGIAKGLFSLSSERQILGGYLVYYVLAAVAVSLIVAASFLPRKLWNEQRP